MSKKNLYRRLKGLPSQEDAAFGGSDYELVNDLFGLEMSDEADSKDENVSGPGKKKRKAKFDDIPEKAMKEIFGYLKKPDLMSLRRVSKSVNQVATQIFEDVHTPIKIDSDEKIINFNRDMASVFNFPFTRFHMVLQTIKRHLLITFSRQYVEHIKKLWIEPFASEAYIPSSREDGEILNGGGGGVHHEPSQRLLWKLTGILQQITEVEELSIKFPSLSSFDYSNLEFENKFDLEQLKNLSISFTKNGFCKFSSDLTLEILSRAEHLEKLYLRLPEPTDRDTESSDLIRVLVHATDVPSIGLHLIVNTARNPILGAICTVASQGANNNIRGLTLTLGLRVHEFGSIVDLLNALQPSLIKLKMRRRLGPPSGYFQGVINLPKLPQLKFLDIESHRIPFAPIRVTPYFPKLQDLRLHLRYGNEEFYKKSCLHPLDQLSLYFHETSIMHVQIPPELLDKLVSNVLKELKLINPPPGHLTFMSYWGQDIQKLVIAAPAAYGDDPSYPVHHVLAQLRGTMQFRDGDFNDLRMLIELRELHLLFPIDEPTAQYLAELPRLWYLVVDDSKVSKEIIRRLRNQHQTYISWSPSDSGSGSKNNYPF